MALAIYRKYRPATFGEVIGQEPIIAVLKESARQGKLAHAYLFSGPRGTGKTTTARLIAKIANCEKRSADKDFRAQGEPCNACRSCREIDEGRSIDTVEIDAASNRGIDEIRDLKEQVRTTPVSSSSKVFIIDEAHQLTKEAFNALLKTLEEPPAYVVFVLATTEPDRIPATILSRTQQFHFRHVPLENIVQKLTGIAVRESIVISKEALDLIASAAEGSFRDAESLLDQLVAFDGKNVTIREVESMLGNVGFDTLAAFAGFLLSGSTEHALMKLSEIEDGGYNLVQFAKDLIQYVRRVAVLKFNPGMAEVFRREYLAEHVLQLEAHAKLFTDEHLALLKSLIRA
jgi:DNA polymerase-3 subunit gamma/tau